VIKGDMQQRRVMVIGLGGGIEEIFVCFMKYPHLLRVSTALGSRTGLCSALQPHGGRYSHDQSPIISTTLSVSVHSSSIINKPLHHHHTPHTI